MILAYTLAHYFFPRYSNNHRAKLLHSSTLLILSAILIAFQFFLQTVPYSGIKVLGYAANIPPDAIIALTNEKRSEAGLTTLQLNGSLSQAAKAKGEHMLANEYWAHTAPDGTEPWSFFVGVGYKYRYAGENLARDFSDPNSAVEAWMASPSHRDNLLSSKYKEIGVAVVEGDLEGVDTTIIVQFFGTQLTGSEGTVPLVAEAAKPQTTVTPTLTPIPTVTLTPTPGGAPSALTTPVISQNPEKLLTGEPSREEASGLKVLVSPFSTTRNVSLATIVLLLIVMVVDGIVTARRKTPRVGGRVIAHMAFLGVVLSILLIARAGEIL